MMKDFCLATCSRLEGHGSALLLSDHANDFQRFLQRGDLFTQPLNFALRGVVVLVELAVCGIELVLPLLPFGLGSCLFLRRLGVSLITWTIRTPADWAKARRYTDQITFEGFDPDA